MNVKSTLKALKNLVEKNSPLYLGNGEFGTFKCKFNSPATNLEIEDFEKETSCLLPEDFKDFLLINNGVVFSSAFDKIFSLDIIKGMHSGSLVENVYRIATIKDYFIAINRNEISTDKYIYVAETGSPDKYQSLSIDFKTFFDRLISSNVQNYWSWFDCDTYFNFSN